MPINIPLPYVSRELAQFHPFFIELLRRAVDGSIAMPDTFGIILASPDGTRYRLGVANDGALTTTPL